MNEKSINVFKNHSSYKFTLWLDYTNTLLTPCLNCCRQTMQCFMSWSTCCKQRWALIVINLRLSN